MSLREKLNTNPLIAIAALVILVVAAGWYCYTVLTDRGGTADAPKYYYYTVDEGKTLFSVSADEIPPIMKDGKEAVRARIYTCDNFKTTFVGYLEKYTDDFKKKAEAEKAKPKDANVKGASSAVWGGPAQAFNTLVKKPGEGAWAVLTSQQGQKAMGVTCPSGNVQDLVEKLP